MAGNPETPEKHGKTVEFAGQRTRTKARLSVGTPQRRHEALRNAVKKLLAEYDEKVCDPGYVDDAWVKTMLDAGWHPMFVMAADLRARGHSWAEVADMLNAAGFDCSKDTLRVRSQQFRELIDARADCLRMDALARVKKAMPVQEGIAMDPEHKENTRAFRNLQDIAFPRGGNKVEFNVAGRDVVHGGQQNLQASVTFQQLAELSDEDLAKRIEACDAEYLRPEVPGRGEGA